MDHIDSLVPPTQPEDPARLDDASRPDNAWQTIREEAAHDDQVRVPGHWWTPPATPLVDAAEETALHNLWPFRSQNRICFATGPSWTEDAEVAVLPVCLQLGPGEDYSVLVGDPYEHQSVAYVTGVPEAAARKAAELAEVEELANANANA